MLTRIWQLIYQLSVPFVSFGSPCRGRTQTGGARIWLAASPLAWQRAAHGMAAA
jgi:hypothetical protein